jgi:hypothetical protein
MPHLAEGSGVAPASPPTGAGVRRAMETSPLPGSLARHHAAGEPAARQGHLRGLPHAPAAVGAAFSRQPRDLYTALGGAKNQCTEW